MRKLTFIILWITVFSIKVSANNPVESDTVRELPLPQVPDSLKRPAERADYIIAHFWDKMDFSDPEIVNDSSFIEQNFVNYINLFSHANENSLPENVSAFLKASEVSPSVAHMIYDLADKYFSYNDSPFRNDKYNILFLKNAINSNSLSEAERARSNYRLESAQKNIPGSKFPDFKIIMREGEESNIEACLNKDKNLIIFYDPDCSHCVETIDKIKKLSTIDSFPHVIAIDVTDDRQLWDDTKNNLPKDWDVTFASEPIEDNELFIFEEMPTLFLVNGDGMIILKNTTIEEIVSQAIPINNDEGDKVD